MSLPSVLCYDPPPYAPAVSAPPALARGHVTFGAFNRLPKISDATVAAWGRVLAAVPDARLVVKCGGADASPERERLLARLAAVGVAEERVTLLGATPHPDHLGAHAEIDLMLDTFPQSGGITTLDALLMGVPVVTLLGERVPGRVSASLLTTLGLEDLVARTTDEYVEIAATLAGDLDRLARERATLRDRLLASPIADAERYTRAVEATYRDLWRRWCDDRAGAGRGARGERGDEGDTMSRRSRLAAADAGQLLTRAVQHHQEGKLDAAETLYRDVLRVDARAAGRAPPAGRPGAPARAPGRRRRPGSGERSPRGPRAPSTTATSAWRSRRSASWTTRGRRWSGPSRWTRGTSTPASTSA